MSNPIYENIKRDPRYAQLVQRRGRFANTLALTVIGVFFSFVLLVAFMPALSPSAFGTTATSPSALRWGCFSSSFSA